MIEKTEQKTECDTCIIKGYSPDLCKMHLKHMAHQSHQSSHKKSSITPEMAKKLGGSAAVGIGIGLLSSVAGIALIPALGIKALIAGELAAFKVAAAGGVVGAGANVAFNAAKKP